MLSYLGNVHMFSRHSLLFCTIICIIYNINSKIADLNICILGNYVICIYLVIKKLHTAGGGLTKSCQPRSHLIASAHLPHHANMPSYPSSRKHALTRLSKNFWNLSSTPLIASVRALLSFNQLLLLRHSHMHLNHHHHHHTTIIQTTYILPALNPVRRVFSKQGR
jgi:hypothetical protein